MEIRTTKEIFDWCIENQIISTKLISEMNELSSDKWVRVDDILKQLKTPKRTKERIIQMLRGDDKNGNKNNKRNNDKYERSQ
jgi:hypothetical protein